MRTKDGRRLFAVILLGCNKPISKVTTNNYLAVSKVSNQLEKPKFSVHVSHRAINHIATKIDRLSFIYTEKNSSKDY